jgi:hypothetical protein
MELQNLNTFLRSSDCIAVSAILEIPQNVIYCCIHLYATDSFHLYYLVVNILDTPGVQNLVKSSEARVVSYVQFSLMYIASTQL